MIENSSWQGNLTKIRYGSASVGDIDNNGYQDIVITGCLSAGGLDCDNGAVSKIYINNGTTLRENSQWQNNLTALGWSSTSLGDIDNDGDLDLALTGCISATSAGGCTGSLLAKIYINNGTTLTESLQWESNLSYIFDGSLAFGDINNDGDLDLALIGDSGSKKIAKIYINNGTSLVESSQWQQNLIAIRSGALVLGDIDNDGKLDLALTGEADGVTSITKVYINNGTSLVESSQWQQNLIAAQDSSLTFGDIDNDGDLDLALIGVGDYLFIYKNNGTKFIENQKNSGEGGDLGGGLFDGSIAFGDYDNDGDLDFAGMGLESGRNAVYKNNESKNYNFSIDTTAGNNFTNNDMHNGPLAWVDLDNDTDLDLISIGTNSVIGILAKVYINNNTIPNTKPAPPTSSFSSTYANNILNLSWGNGSDVQTNTSGLYYNLMVGNLTNNHTIISGVYGGSSGGGTGGGPSAGYFGNMMQRKSISLNVNLGNGTYYWYVQTIDTGLAKSNWSERQNFTVETDATSPVLSGISSSAAASSAAITWTTNELSNSTIYYGTTTSTTSSSSSSSLVTSHSVSLSGLPASTLYYYNVSSCDSSNNCNTSSQYNFTTSAAGDSGTGSGSSGGGSGGTTVTKNATNITSQLKKFNIDFSKTTNGSFEARQGDIKTFSFNGEVLHKITISEIIGNSVKLIIESEAIILVLNAGETKRVDINKDSINDFEIKLVSIINGMASFSLKKLAGADIVGKEELEEAVRKEALFDVKVHILDKFKEVFPGEEVSAKIEVFNINNIGQVDVVVDYYLSDNERVFGSGGSDTLAVEAVASFVRSLIIPEDLKPGIYYFNVDVGYKNFTTSGKSEFKVKSKKLIFIEKRWKEILIIAISVIALIAIAAFIYLGRIKKREEKLEKKEARLERIIKKSKKQ